MYIIYTNIVYVCVHIYIYIERERDIDLYVAMCQLAQERQHVIASRGYEAGSGIGYETGYWTSIVWRGPLINVAQLESHAQPALPSSPILSGHTCLSSKLVLHVYECMYKCTQACRHTGMQVRRHAGTRTYVNTGSRTVQRIARHK